MKRTERHQLKQDEFVAGLERATDWFMENRRSIVNVLLVVVGAALLLGGLYIYRTRQAETAQGLLVKAMEVYQGAVLAGGDDGAERTAPTFETTEAKYRAALESFQEVADGFSSYEAGRQARYFAGLCHERLGELEAAESSLEQVRSGERDLLYYLATRALAAVKAERGNHAEASDIYRGLIEDEASPLPKDQLLFELAKVEERAGNLEQARLYYERMLQQHPDSQLRGDARSRSNVLQFRIESRSDLGG